MALYVTLDSQNNNRPYIVTIFDNSNHSTLVLDLNKFPWVQLLKEVNNVGDYTGTIMLRNPDITYLIKAVDVVKIQNNVYTNPSVQQVWTDLIKYIFINRVILSEEEVVELITSGVAGVSSFNGRTGAVTLLFNDVTNALGYVPFPTPTGSIFQYVRGDGSLATFPTALSAFTNDVGYITASSHDNLTNKTGLISMWTNDVGYITNASLGDYYKQGGNSFGALALLGTLDNQALQLMSNSQSALLLDATGSTRKATFWPSIANGVVRINGSLGIGNNLDPLAPLHVNTSISATPIAQLTNTSSTGYGIFASTGSIDATRYILALNYSNPGGVFNGGTSAFIVRGDGNTGIGVSNPLARLEVNNYARFIGSTGALVGIPTSGAGIEITYDTTTGIGYIFGYDRTANSVQSLSLGRSNFPLFLQNDGKVGIGTTTPSFALDVNGGFGASDRGYPTSFNGGFGAQFYIVHSSGNWGFSITRAQNDSGGANLALFKTRTATASAKVASIAGDLIGRITWQAVASDNATVSVAAEQGVNVISVGTNFIQPYFYWNTVDAAGTNLTRMRLSSEGLALGNNFVATARLHVLGGTGLPGTASIKLNTGTLLTTIEDGALEYGSSHLWFTIGGTRYQLDQQLASFAIGSTIVGGTAGSVLFINPNNILAQDNANFFWDVTNKTLKVLTLQVSNGTAPTGVNNPIVFNSNIASQGDGILLKAANGTKQTPGLTFRSNDNLQYAQIYADSSRLYFNTSAGNGVIQQPSAFLYRLDNRLAKFAVTPNETYLPDASGFFKAIWDGGMGLMVAASSATQTTDIFRVTSYDLTAVYQTTTASGKTLFGTSTDQGIGQVQIYGSSSSNNVNLGIKNASSANYAGIELRNDTTNLASLFYGGTTFSFAGMDDTVGIYSAGTKGIYLMADGTTGYIRFAAGGEVEQMRLSTAGNLLLGTSTDAGFRLNVNGKAYIHYNGAPQLYFDTQFSGGSALTMGYESGYNFYIRTNNGGQGSLNIDFSGLATIQYLIGFVSSTPYLSHGYTIDTLFLNTVGKALWFGDLGGSNDSSTSSKSGIVFNKTMDGQYYNFTTDPAISVFNGNYTSTIGNVYGYKAFWYRNGYIGIGTTNTVTNTTNPLRAALTINQGTKDGWNNVNQTIKTQVVTSTTPGTIVTFSPGNGNNVPAYGLVVGSKITANSLTRTVVAVNGDSITVDSVVDWVAGYDFTYRNPYVDIADGTTPYFHIAPSGNVLIGTRIDDGNKLQVNGNISFSDIVWGNGTSGSVIFVGSDKKLAQDNSQLFWDDVNNRLGVGTNTPIWQMTIKSPNVNTGVFTVTGPTDLPTSSFGIWPTGAGFLQIYNGSGTNVIQLSGQAGTYTYFNSGTNIGVGTATPATVMDIVTGISSGTTGDANSIRLRHRDNTSYMQMQMGVSTTAVGGANNGYGYINTSYVGASDNNPLLLQTTGGTVGINTVSGGVRYPLTVTGTIVTRATSTTVGIPGGTLGFGHMEPYVYSAFIAGIYDKTLWPAGMGMIFATVSGSDISGVTGIERMRISSDGSVAINTTTPGISTKLQVNGLTLITGGVTNPNDGTPAGLSLTYETTTNGAGAYVSAVQTGVTWSPLFIQSVPGSNGNTFINTDGGKVMVGYSVASSYAKVEITDSAAGGTIKTQMAVINRTTGGTAGITFANPGNGWGVNMWTNPGNGWFEFGTSAGAYIRLWQADYLNASTGLIGWSSETNFATPAVGARDVAIGRNAAGVLEINNGTPSTYRDLKLRTITITDGTNTNFAQMSFFNGILINVNNISQLQLGFDMTVKSDRIFVAKRDGTIYGTFNGTDESLTITQLNVTNFTIGNPAYLSLGTATANYDNVTFNTDASFILGLNLSFKDNSTNKNVLVTPMTTAFGTAGIVMGGNGATVQSGVVTPGDIAFYAVTTSTTAGATFSTNPQMFIKGSTGAVGIGVALPLTRLHAVQSTAALQFSSGGDDNTPTLSLLRTGSSGQTVFNMSTTGVGFIANTSGEFRLNLAATWFPTFYSSGSERMRIATSGNVLIGLTTDNGYKLNVKGNNLKSGASETLAVFESADGSQPLALFISNGNSATASDRYVSIQAVEESVSYRPLVLQALGSSVLIGTTTDNGSGIFQVNGNMATSGSSAGVTIFDRSGGGTAMVLYASGGTFSAFSSTTGTDMFKINMSNGLVTFPTSGASANVLIGGNTNNGNRLQVYGNAYVQNEINLANGGYVVNNSLLTYISNGGGSAGYIGFGFTNTASPNVANTVFNIYQGQGVAPSDLFNFKHTLANSTGNNTAYAIINITTGINQTGGSNGVVWGLLYNPTITAINGQHRAIETVTGDVLFCTTSGKVGIGTTAPSAKLQVQAASGNAVDFSLSNVSNVALFSMSTDSGGVASLSSYYAQTYNIQNSPYIYTWQSAGATRMTLNDGDLSIAGTFAGAGIKLRYVTKTAAYTLTTTDYTVDCTSGTFTVTLPTAVGALGQIYNIINSGAGTITVATTSSQTIGNTTSDPTSVTVNPGSNLQVQSTGANWRIL